MEDIQREIYMDSLTSSDLADAHGEFRRSNKKQRLTIPSWWTNGQPATKYICHAGVLVLPFTCNQLI